MSPRKIITKRAEAIALALKDHGIPLDPLTARILRRMADEIEARWTQRPSSR